LDISGHLASPARSDLWWHLASGRDILQHHRIPSVDVFSLTASGTRWINSYWLYDLVVYELYAHFGPGFLTFLHAFVVLGIFYFVDRRMVENGLRGIAFSALAVFYWGAAPAAGIGDPRRVCDTFFCFGLAVCVESWKRKGWSRFCGLGPPLFCLANMHRGFVLGCVLPPSPS